MEGRAEIAEAGIRHAGGGRIVHRLEVAMLAAGQGFASVVLLSGSS